MIIYVISTNLGMEMGWGSYPPPRPVLGETFFPRPRPNMNFQNFFFLAKLHKIKKFH